MSGLLIQHARWQGELVTPDDTRLEVGLKCGCVCIECGEPLVLRCGEKKRRHFAHRAETSCSGETYVHEVVKTWIAEKLPGQIIPLLPHPELDSPQGFRVEKGWQEKRSEETYRKYDVVLEGMFLYEKAGQEKRGCLIFEVYYSNAKDDDFKWLCCIKIMRTAIPYWSSRLCPQFDLHRIGPSQGSHPIEDSTVGSGFHLPARRRTE